MTYDHDRLDRFATVALARLPGSRTRLYAGLLTFRNSTTYTCWPSVRTLADLTGLSSRSVKYALADLAAVGLIRRTFRGRGGNLYEFARGAVHNFPDPPAVAPKPPPEIQPPIPMALPAPVDDAEKWGKNGAKMGQRLAPLTPEMGQQIAPPSEPVKIFEPTPPPAVGQLTHDRAHDVGNDGSGIETNEQPPTDPVAAELAESAERIADRVAARIGRGGVWPRHPKFRHRLGVWMAAGWTRDHLVGHFVERTEREAVKDPGAVIASILASDPPTAPYAPDHARPLAWHARRDADRRAAEQRQAAENGTNAELVPTGSPERAVDPFVAMFGSLLRGDPSQAVLDVVEGRTADLATTGTEG